MKIVLLTSDYHLSANIAVKTFLAHPRLKKHDIQIAGIIACPPYQTNDSTFQSMQSFIKQAGWAFSLKSILTTIWKTFAIKFGKWFVPNKNREYFDIDELATEHNIPLLEAHNINSKKAKAFMRKFQPDYLVSCFLIQIVDKEVLEIPQKGAINIHPALIQKHRGRLTAFWTLLKNWKRAGATVHFMTEKVDQGMIILQKHFFVYPSDTIYSVNKKSAELGAKLLIKALIKLKRKEIKGYFIKRLGQMFKTPTVEDIKEFYRRGKSIMTVRNFFEI